MKRISAFLMGVLLVFSLAACGTDSRESETDSAGTTENTEVTERTGPVENRDDTMSDPPENFVLITGGTFEMGSPDTESWRSVDETQHTVTVSDFYMSMYEVTQEEYAEVMGNDPSSFSDGMLPVETVSWLDAVRYCNGRSELEGLTLAYSIEGRTVTWDRSADGYRLPTEAEWEYACRAGTTTPFNTENSISAEEVKDPTGPETGTLRVYRGGGWNDFAKNMWSAYRAAMAEDKSSFNIGIRLVRNAASGTGSVVSTGTGQGESAGGKILIAYFSWGGNTRGIAEEIQSQTGANLFEIMLTDPYSTDYNTVLDEAQRDQNEQARPELADPVENMEEYDIILLGYPKMEQGFNCVLCA